MTKHKLSYGKHTETIEYSHGREADHRDILIMCSCGWRVSMPDVYDGVQGRPTTSDMATRRVRDHKIDVLLKAVGIEFEDEGMPMGYELKEMKGWE